jgi:hypothetical protein
MAYFLVISLQHNLISYIYTGDSDCPVNEVSSVWGTKQNRRLLPHLRTQTFCSIVFRIRDDRQESKNPVIQSIPTNISDSFPQYLQATRDHLFIFLHHSTQCSPSHSQHLSTPPRPSKLNCSLSAVISYKEKECQDTWFVLVQDMVQW